MSAARRKICESTHLREGADGVRFRVQIGGEVLPAFAVRYRGRVYAFVNRCAHRGLELDWREGHFFDAEEAFLVCATHGARYHPDSGECAGGPCAGNGLRALAIQEGDDAVWLATDNAYLAV